MIEGLKPYSKYKDSGLPWLDQLPLTWSAPRTKSRFRLRIEKSGRNHGLELLSIYTHVGVRNKASSTNDYWVVRKGDIIVNKLLAWMGAVGVSHYDGVTSPAYDILRPLQEHEPVYYHHLFRTPLYLQLFKARSRGIMDMRLRLYFDELGQIPLLCPPIDEQAAIVKFLDYANGKIERAIRAKRKLIGLLNEQKQAIIHRAVTQGLDPNVKLKPSGIPWLGEVPEHWEIRRLKSLGTKFGSGVTPRGGSAIYQDLGVPLLRSQNIHFGELRLQNVARISRDIHLKMSGTHVKPKDVLLNITGASIGRACSVPEPFEDANVNQHVCIIRPIHSRCDAEYLAMFLATEAAQTAIYIAQNGSSREGLPVSEVKSLPIVLPPMVEQIEIGVCIQRDTRLARDSAAQIEREIELLREYRTTLTAEVVTGKLDVREAAKRLPDQTDEPLPPDESLEDLVDDEITEGDEA